MLSLGNSEQEQAEAMKRYIREVFIPEYARNFNKGLSTEDIKFYGKIHFDRSRSDNKLNMHCHLIVSRKDQSNKVKISPLTNHRNTKKGAIKGGFDRTALFENVEKGFDKLFGYDRQLPETFTYCNTMKNGSITEKLQMQEEKIVSDNEIKKGFSDNKQASETDFSTSVQQQVSTSVNQSTNKSVNQSSDLGGLFSFLPSAADINTNPADEQPLRKLKKKKKGKRIG